MKWQRDLSNSHERIGEMLSIQCDNAAALSAYRASMKIREELAARDPANAESQISLVISCWNIARLLTEGVNRREALELLQRAQGILTQLTSQQKTVRSDQQHMYASIVAQIASCNRGVEQMHTGLVYKTSNQ
jgi:hypothetical protein